MSTSVDAVHRALQELSRLRANTNSLLRSLDKSIKLQIKQAAGKARRIFFSLDREFIAKTYIHGKGIEIGALQSPLKVPGNAHVTYVDRMQVKDLRKQYPELNAVPLVHVDEVADGELLETIDDSSQDFVIANHFLEHCQNPILAISNMMRVLKNDGVIYLAIPDKRYTFDIGRPVTTIDHLMRDYKEGPDWSRKQHFEEWANLVDKTESGAATEQRVAELMDIDYSIHYHVWTQSTLLELLTTLKGSLGLHFDMELFLKSGHEVICVLRKDV